MIVGVKEMLLELRCKVDSTVQGLQLICRWQFQSRQHSDERLSESNAHDP